MTIESKNFNAIVPARGVPGIFAKPDLIAAATTVGYLEAARKATAAAKPVNTPDPRTPPTGEQWEAPFPFGRINTPEIPASLLPGVFGEYVAAMSKSFQTPPAMGVGFTLAILGLCLQRKFKVSPFSDGYAEPVCIWTLSLAESGERKSAVIQLLLKPVILFETKVANAMRAEIIERETQRKINLRRIEKLQTDAAKEDDPVRRGGLVREIAELAEKTPEELKPIRLFTSDVTTEKFQSLLSEHGGCMAVMSDEGAIFLVMAGMYSGGEVYVDVYLQSYSGSSVRVDRGTRSEMIERATSTFGIGMQPGILKDMAPQAKRKFRVSGVNARFLYFYPESRVGTRDMGQQPPIPPELEVRYRAEVLRLLEIKPRLDIEDGEDDEHILVLSDRARVMWVAFAQKIESDQADGGALEGIRDWCAKLPGGALRVAGLFHVAGHGRADEEISEATMTKALDLCLRLIPHALAVFDLLGSDQTTDDAKLAWRWIERQDKQEFLRSELHRAHHSRFTKLDRLVAALEMLKGRNLIAGPYTGTVTNGRPPIFYRVNPLAMKGSNE